MANATFEAKKQACRDILERGLDALSEPIEPGSIVWFEWDGLLVELHEALKDLETAARSASTAE